MSDEVENVFVEKIIKNKIKPPTRFDFKLDSWIEEWEKVKGTASKRDGKIFASGCVIDSLLSEIRTLLDDAYLRAPKTTNEKLILAYVAMSNRELAVAMKNALAETRASAFGIKINANYIGNSLTLQEISHGCVDGLQPAIRMCQKRIDDNQPIKKSAAPDDLMSFIRYEIDLSQLYVLYSHVWQCLFWSDYDLIQVDKEQKVYCVKQPASEFEFSFENSAIRRERLSAQKGHIATDPTIQAIFSGDKYVVIRKQGKRKLAEVAHVKGADEVTLSRNAHWQITTTDMLKYYPEEWLIKEHGKGFAIRDALSVMRCLMLMSGDLMERFPEDDSVWSLNKLLQFCPTVQALSLKFALMKATGLAAEKVSNILEFMTFKADKTSDLWCQPLIKKSNSHYAISVSALASPVMTRLIEKWCVELGIDLTQKGYKYEQTVVDLLNEQLVQNEFIDDYDQAVGKRIKLQAGEEEFDLLARVDDLIIVGEFKATLTVDSEVMKQRTADTLQYAGIQVNRKTKFLQANIESVFKRLGWKYDSTKQYNFAQCIVNSARIFIGYKFDGVPVVDEKILNSYFESKTMSLLAVPCEQGDMRDIAWYELYSDLKELKDNLQPYLLRPPQLSEIEDSFEYSNVQLPAISQDSFKILQRRFVLKDVSPTYRMEQEHDFRVFKSADYEEQIAKVDMIM
ncbi:Conserved hypothetical protein [Shewanella piezotolerans WP3]|uniref:Uncharacterized protein n=1 Tax=Shewanella piezotolerans (strain WP3 / JCM 13877) TaxID=225849 RepID=B8CRD2_SHEPW|nr:hypothetical protein [Shewanella piezotolerans]ACJ29940.1 Conserved hypothetical protein [Shewanella piezotolerans WP3]